MSSDPATPRAALPKVGAISYDDECPWCGTELSDLHEAIGRGTECPNCGAVSKVGIDSRYVLTLTKTGDTDKAIKFEALPPDDAWLPPIHSPEDVAEHIMRDTPRGLSEAYYAKLIVIAIRRAREAGRRDTDTGGGE